MGAGSSFNCFSLPAAGQVGLHLTSACHSRMRWTMQHVINYVSYNSVAWLPSDCCWARRRTVCAGGCGHGRSWQSVCCWRIQPDVAPESAEPHSLLALWAGWPLGCGHREVQLCSTVRLTMMQPVCAKGWIEHFSACSRRLDCSGLCWSKSRLLPGRVLCDFAGTYNSSSSLQAVPSFLAADSARIILCTRED